MPDHPLSERLLSVRFTASLAAVAELHVRQPRKKTARTVPYVSHLLAVAGAVLDDGGSEDEAIAGLFHDAIEDQGVTVAQLSQDYGPEVARIVAACSDAAPRPGETKPPWLGRKETHIAHLRALGPDEPVLRVTAADKLHNCSDILADLQEEGVGIERLDEFNGGRVGTCWYYGELADLLEQGLPHSRLTKGLSRAARELHQRAGLEYPAPKPDVPTRDSGGAQKPRTTMTLIDPTDRTPEEVHRALCEALGSSPAPEPEEQSGS